MTTDNPGDGLTITPATPTSERDAINRALGNNTVYTNTGGHGDDAETFKAPPPSGRRPGQRLGLTVEITDGQAVTVGEGDSLFGSPKTAPDAPTTTWSKEPLKFYSAGSSTPVLARDVGTDTIVDLGGKIGEMSVGAAIHCGWLTDTGHGFERAGEAKAPAAPKRSTTPTRAADDTDADADDADMDTGETDTATPEQPAPRDYLDHADEAMLRDVESHVGPDLYAAAESFLTNGEEIPEHLMSRLAASMGGDEAVARQAVAQAVQPFYAQATAVVEKALPGNSELVFEWSRSDPKGQELLREAMRAQANERSTKGYTSLAKAYLADLATKDPHAVADGINRSGTAKARVSGKDVVVNLGGNRGEVSFVAAMKMGLV
jgi:hypothetical protein